MFRRQYALAAAAVLVLSPLLVGGCSSDKKATARVTFDSSISPGSHTTADCPEPGSTWLQIGSFGNPGAGKNPDGSPVDPVTPVDDGGEFSQGHASVACSVTGEGDGFHVSATASLDGATGGAFRIEGHFTAQGDQPKIDISLTALNRGTYSEHDCVARYSQPLQTVAAGRAWADFDCPNGEAKSLQRTCHLQGQFRFENCVQ